MDAMKEIGLVHILEKKDCIIEGKTYTYYEVIDYTIGFPYEFHTTTEIFVCLTGKFQGTAIPLNDNKYRVAQFKTFSTLSKNSSFDLNEFTKDYQTIIGNYCIYENDDCLYLLEDEQIISAIKKQKKDYDASILTEKSDISQMYSKIKETIIAQDEPIMQILTSLFKNQKVVNFPFDIDMITKLKENLLIYGATGTGKTEILKRISKIYNVPIVIEDATSLSEVGYVGRDITNMLENLYLAADKKKEIAENGILVIDEFDKLAENAGDQKSHVSRSGVQRSLLKLLDGSTFYFNNIKFDTSKLSIVALGAFEGITPNDDYSNLSAQDFVNYGIMRELMGRFSKLVAMNPLKEEDIKNILVCSNFSPLNTYKQLFDSMNIVFTYDDSFIEYIAKKAVALGTGARSLKTIFDNEISSAMFYIFAGNYSAIHMTRPCGNTKSYSLTK